MDNAQLLTAPARSLTRKQRRDRAALKRQIIGEVREQTVAGHPASPLHLNRMARPYAFGRAIEVGEHDVTPREGHVIIRVPGMDR